MEAHLTCGFVFVTLSLLKAVKGEGPCVPHKLLLPCNTDF